MRQTYWIIALCLAAGGFAAGDEPVDGFPRVPHIEPAVAANTFRTLGGFQMDLLAAEPLVADPVALAYDENGQAYVAEMSDYPFTDAATHQPWKDNTTDKPLGQIRLLIDADGDGDFDKSTVFADALSWPTGVACWKGGVFVAATPDVWYLKDTDGDGRADVRRKVLTGFRKYNVQAVMNNLIWGLDNCLYGAGGSNGGSVVLPDQPGAEPVALTRNDFRFDPWSERFETIPGGARFGNTFDDWGNRFVCNIRNPAQHIVLESRYLARNPHVPVASVVHDVAESGDALPVYRLSAPEQWRDVRARRLAAERSSQPRSELVAGGVVTSSSGITVYRGDAYPPEFRSQFFIGEVANNLLHRQVLRPDGVTFASRRVDERVDFVASTDVWFRPVNFVNAPDGTLHVLDMYREVIEHPWSIPDDIREKLDLRSGSDRGRIYRLAPPGFKAPSPPRLGQASSAELVATLANPNAWWRETAQRLLVERQDRSAVEPLRQLLVTATGPLARLHALWTLEGLGAAGEADILRGLDDAAPGVRENAVRLAERHLKGAPRLLDRLLQCADDVDIRVRFQAALTLGESDDPRVTDALATLARRDAGDRWVLAAILSSAVGRSTDLLARLSAEQDFAASEPGAEALRQLALVLGVQNEPEDVTRVLAALPASARARMSIAAGLGEGLRRDRRTLRQAMADTAPPAAETVAELLADAGRTAADASAPEADRIMAIRLLGFDDPDRVVNIIGDLLDHRHPAEVQRAAVAALAGINRTEVGPLLLSRWGSYTPGLRAEVIQAMLGYKSRIPTLLDALEAGRISVTDIPVSRRTPLVKAADERIRTRALALFGTGATGERKDVLDRYAQALQLKGDPTNGQKVYEAACAACHRLGDQGHDVGPNLATVRPWGPEQLLTNILDPNREVAPAYVEYIVELTDGEILSGIIAEETGTSLTITTAGGIQRLIPRQTVKRITGSRLSLMPEGLEAGISPQQMADLIGFLRAAQ